MREEQLAAARSRSRVRRFDLYVSNYSVTYMTMGMDLPRALSLDKETPDYAT